MNKKTLAMVFVAVISFLFVSFPIRQTHAMESTYRATNTDAIVSLSSTSYAYLAINSILAAGGTWSSDLVQRAYENYLDWSYQTGSYGLYHIIRHGDNNYMEVTMQTIRRVWDDVVWWVNNGMDYWTREELVINPPNHHVEQVGSFAGLTIIADPGNNLIVSAPVTGPTTVTIGNQTFELLRYPGQPEYTIVYRINGGPLLAMHSFYPLWQITNYGWMLTQRANGNIYLGAAITTLTTSTQQVRHEVNRGMIRVFLPTITPPSQPIILRPTNIIDNRTNVINIINEIIVVNCDDCVVWIRIPDNPHDMRDRPIHEIIFPPVNNNGGNDTPCVCEPLDEDALFTRIWDRFMLDFSEDDEESGGGNWFTRFLNNWTWPALPTFNWPSLPSFNWPTMPDWWTWPSLPSISETFWNPIRDFFSSIFVPTEGFLQLRFDTLRTDFTDRLPFQTFMEMVNQLSTVSESDPGPARVSSHQGTDVLYEFNLLPILQPFISLARILVTGFYVILFVVYNLRQIQYLIRGSYLHSKATA